MPAVTLGSVSLAADASYTSTGKWVEKLFVGAPVYLKSFPDAAGIDGTGKKNYGFRSRSAVVDAVYVAASEAAAFSTPMDDLESLASDAFAATIAGDSWAVCELDAEACEVGTEARPTGDGKFWCRARFAIVQRGLT